MKRLLGLVLVIAGLCYPLAVYLSIESWSPRWIALLLGALWLGRLVGKHTRGDLLLSLTVLCFIALLWMKNDPDWLLWYPVLMNSLLLAGFTMSLYFGPPVIERLARLTEPDLEEKGVAYTRQVTKAWALFFLLNGMVAATLALFAPLSWWTLYNGLVAYLLMGLLFAIEWLIRQHVRKAT